MKLYKQGNVEHWVALLRIWTLSCVCALLMSVPVTAQAAVDSVVETIGTTNDVANKHNRVEVTASNLSPAVQQELQKPIDWSNIETSPVLDSENELSISSAMTQMFFGLLIVIAMIVAAAWSYRRWGKRLMHAGSRQQYMELVETMPLGVKRAISLVRVGDQVLVLGQGEHDVIFLCSLDAEKLQSIDGDVQDINFESGDNAESILSASDAASELELEVKNNAPLGAFKSKLEKMLRPKS
ncbi:MAG: flagellar biosynthetic protein FliO [Planctomycetes bacterium]|nr:flagellar biosynthetic protein FliO [Planctomycetota bacterium]